MKTRIARMFCQSKCRDVWVVQKWMTKEEIAKWASAGVKESLEEHWESIRDFELGDYDKATSFAMDLSLTKRTTIEMAVFDDGVCVSQINALNTAQTQ